MWLLTMNTVFELLKLIGSLALFIYGMKVMSEGLQNVAGSKLRFMMSYLTSNKYKGVLSGFLLTILIQSSSATTVMVVSFVNAGLLSLTQAIGVIMGANIGTTATAWLISIFGFKFKIITITLPVMAIGVPLLFSAKSSLRYWGDTFIGFALLFIGLDFLKNTIPDLQNHLDLFTWLQQYTQMGILSTIMFIIIGTTLTILVQSSSAAMAITLVMCNNGWIPLESAAAIVLGENIGTTITANIASIIGNIHAKRAARAHLIFNVFGIFWMLLCFPFFLDFIDWIIQLNYGVSSFDAAQYTIIPIALSLFHTIFNLANMILLIGFTNWIVKVVSWLVKTKDEEDEIYYLEFTLKGIFQSPAISIVEVRKEQIKFAELITKMASSVQKIILESKKKQKQKSLAKVKRYYEISKQLEYEMRNFLSQLLAYHNSKNISLQAYSVLEVVNNLKNITNIFYQVSGLLIDKMQKGVFKKEQKDAIIQSFQLIDQALGIMIANLNTDYKSITLENAKEKERQINNYRDELRNQYLENVEKGVYNVATSIEYMDLIQKIETIGDEILSVSNNLTAINSRNH